MPSGPCRPSRFRPSRLPLVSGEADVQDLQRGPQVCHERVPGGGVEPPAGELEGQLRQARQRQPHGRDVVIQQLLVADVQAAARRDAAARDKASRGPFIKKKAQAPSIGAWPE